MTVYIDGILLLNFVFDFLLLLTTSIVLKRNAKIFNIIVGAFIGSLSILILFIKINTINLLIIKIYLSIIMNLITFKYKDIKYTITNIVTFYIVSILLGGFLYLLNIEFSYKHQGLIFFHKTPTINTIFLFIIAPVILYIYMKQNKIIKTKIKNYYPVIIIVKKKILNLTGYLDSGNTLTYKGKPVIITNIKNTFKTKSILVPVSTITGTSLMPCIKAKAKIKEKTYNVFLGFSKNLNISGVEVLLNSQMEEIK